jgi:hypothetical protein
MKLKRSLSVLLSVCLLAASSSFTACSDDDVRKVREAASRLVIYSDTGIKALQELRASVKLEGKFGEVAEQAETALIELRDATLLFVEKAKTFTKFDATSRADLARMFVAVTDAVQKLKPKVLVIATKVIEELNRRGFTNIQEPQKVVSRINMALNFLDA